MAIVGNRYYNDPSIGQSIGNLAQLFAPPSVQDMAASAVASATREKAKRLADFYNQSQDPNTSWETLDRSGIGVGAFSPNQSFRAVDIGAATSATNNAADNARALTQTGLEQAGAGDRNRYTVDTGAATATANNAADNARALEERRLQEAGANGRKLLDPYAVKPGEMVFSSPEAQAAYGVGPQVSNNYAVDSTAATSTANNAADNARALEERRMQEEAATGREKLKPFTINDGQTYFASPEAQAAYGAPASGTGAQKLGQGDTTYLPDGRALQGAPKPLSESEWKAQEAARLQGSGQLSDADLKNTIMGGTPVESVVGPDGKPRIAYRPDAVGQQPAPQSPGTVVNLGPNGEPLGNPGEGLVWQRGADGKVVMDGRGAPIAIPFQGGKVFQSQQDAAKQGATRNTTVQRAADVVSQDIDRALAKAGFWTTGWVGDKLSGTGGTAANDVRTLLDTVKSNVGFDKLQAMREASPTGGALGQVSDSENRMLQATLGSLEQSQGTPQFTDNLKRLKNIYLDIIHGPGNGPPREQLGFEQGQTGAAPAAPAAPAQPQAAGAPNFEQMGGSDLRTWVEANPDAVKNLPDAEFQRLRARAQQLQQGGQ